MYNYMSDWLICQKKPVRMFLFSSSLHTTLNILRPNYGIPVYRLFPPQFVDAIFFRAITFIQDNFKDTKGGTSSRI